LPESSSRHAPPSRRLGGELTSGGRIPQRRSFGLPGVVTPRSGTLLRRIYRFHYHRPRETIVAGQIQAAESPRNPGRFKTTYQAKRERRIRRVDWVNGPVET
jgi:hypothetical protein